MKYAHFLPAALLVATGFFTACQSTAPTSTPVSTIPATPAAPLRNTRWVLRTLNAQPLPATQGQEAYVLLREAELRAEGHGSCNRFAGSFELPAEGQLRFGPLLSTRMACLDPAATTTETSFLRALEATRTYRISGDTLRLYGEAGAAPAAVLHAVYLR